MAEFEIKRAERSQALLRTALVGVSGGGKTTSMIRLLRGLAQAMIDAGILAGTLEGKIGIIDTERRSAALYAHRGPFDVIEITRPFTTTRYLTALHIFEDAGYLLIGIDQLSHAWAGAGGLLEKKDAIAAESGRNNFDAFSDITPEQNQFIDEILASPAHLVITMRAKTKWAMETYSKNGKERVKPVRVSMGAVQRPGTEYEFTTVLDLAKDGKVVSTVKDRTELFPEGEPRGLLTEDDGMALARWLYQGAAGSDELRAVSPVEKGRALVQVHVAKFETITNLPDLAREFETALSNVRAVDTGGFNKRAWQDELIAAKDLRKVALSSPPPAGALGVDSIALDPEEVVALESMIDAAGIARKTFLNQFAINRIMQLPPASLEVAKAWIGSQAKAAADAGVS